MGSSIDENYRLCAELSRKGDWDSLNQLRDIYLSTTDFQKRKDARKALAKAHNRSAVIRILYDAVRNAETTEEKHDVYKLGILIERSRFLYDYLLSCLELKDKINKYILDDMKYFAPFTAIEQSEICRFMIDNKCYGISLYRELCEPYSSKVKETIVENIEEGYVEWMMMKIIEEDHLFICRIQEPLRKYIELDIEERIFFIQYLNLSVIENRRLLNSSNNLFSIFSAIMNNKQKIDYHQDDTELTKIALTIKTGDLLSDEQWAVIKSIVENTFDVLDNGGKLNEGIFRFLRELAKIERSYVEKLYISLYERKSSVYSKRVFHELVELRSTFAYNTLIQRFIIAKKIESNCGIITTLMKYFPDKKNEIYSNVINLDNSDVTAHFLKCVEKYNLAIS